MARKSKLWIDGEEQILEQPRRRAVTEIVTTVSGVASQRSRKPESIITCILLMTAKCTERPMFRGGCLENRGSPRDTKVSSAFAAYSMPQRWILLDAISRRICLPSGCGSFWLKEECSSFGVSTRYAFFRKFFLSFQKSSATRHMRIFRGSLKHENLFWFIAAVL